MFEEVGRKRVKSLQQLMEKHGIEALFLTNPVSFEHLVYVTIPDGCIIPKTSDPILITHFYSLDQVKEDSWVKEIIGYYPNRVRAGDKTKPKGLIELAQETISALPGDYHSIGMDYNHTPTSVVETFREKFESTEIKDVFPLLKEVLEAKQGDEIESIRRSVRVAESGVKAAVEFIKEGKTEREIAAYAEYIMRQEGAQGFHFHSNVNSGPRSIIMGAAASGELIRKGELIDLDFGPIVNHYFADICRTTIVGSLSQRQRQNYQVVLEALDVAIDMIKPGVEAGNVDRAAREFFMQKGYDGKFVHHTGHPAGNTWGPMIVPDNHELLKEGMVLALEPGIYEKDVGGVRIEDNVLVTANGAEVLMRYPRGICK